MGESALTGGALRGLAIAAGMVTVFGGAPAFAQCLSTAAGFNGGCAAATATGVGSTAVGSGATAIGPPPPGGSGFFATAYGNNAVANGDFATAAGAGSIANGNQATAVGQGSVANGTQATATGELSVATGTLATATGTFSNAKIGRAHV